MVITEQMRVQLKKNLPRGYASTISKQCKCSLATVYNVLSGSQNQRVAEAIIRLAEKNHAIQNRLIQKVKQM